CIPRTEQEKLKISFVREWSCRQLKISLDEEQAAAVGSLPGDIQVVARAGSGKTRVLITRAIFLIRHCQVKPNAILLLAFNDRAAREIRNRLKEFLDADLPHVMTFHALARALVPQQDL